MKCKHGFDCHIIKELERSRRAVERLNEKIEQERSRQWRFRRYQEWTAEKGKIESENAKLKAEVVRSNKAENNHFRTLQTLQKKMGEQLDELKAIREAASVENILIAIICAIPMLCKDYVIKLGTFARQDLAEAISKSILKEVVDSYRERTNPYKQSDNRG